MNRRNRTGIALGIGALAIVVSLGVLGAMSYARWGTSFGWMGAGCPAGLWDASSAAGAPIGGADAERVAVQYAASYGGAGLEIAEIMAFDNHFYVEVREPQTGRYAFEFLIDRTSGRAVPEPGPNMMWNLKYGHMSGDMMRGRFSSSADGTMMPITANGARTTAQAYLDRAGLGLTVGEHAAGYYGYYTLHTLRDGEIVGMLSVNGYSGEVWLHTWHGTYLGDLIDDEE